MRTEPEVAVEIAEPVFVVGPVSVEILIVVVLVLNRLHSKQCLKCGGTVGGTASPHFFFAYLEDSGKNIHLHPPPTGRELRYYRPSTFFVTTGTDGKQAYRSLT